MKNIQELAAKIDGVLLVLGSKDGYGTPVHLTVDGYMRTVRFFSKESAVEFILTFDLVNFQNSANF